MKTFVPTKLKCDNCPALKFKTIPQLRKIQNWEQIRDNEIDKIEKVNLYLLCESIPYNRFIYYLNTTYDNSGLRYYLKQELIKTGTDEDLILFLRNNGILIVDCALCPLHRLSNTSDRSKAATLCLTNNTKEKLLLNPEAPIITIFPKDKGFNADALKDINSRIIAEFQFSKLSGLNVLINSIIKR